MFKDRVMITEYNEPVESLQIIQKHSVPWKDVHTALTENTSQHKSLEKAGIWGTNITRQRPAVTTKTDLEGYIPGSCSS